jgi:pilus assembly protein Flp/PilA
MKGSQLAARSSKGRVAYTGRQLPFHKGHRMKAVLSKFMKDESGQGLVEYALIIALVAIGLIAILVLFRNAIGNVFNESKNRLNNAPAGSY